MAQSSPVESVEPVKALASGVVQNPHDPEAQWSAKGQGKQKKDWVDKVQVAETVGSQGDTGSFITSVVTQRATESDDAGLPATHGSTTITVERLRMSITHTITIEKQAMRGIFECRRRTTPKCKRASGKQQHLGGLAISRSLVAAHGGRLTATSPGLG
jgi:hypothetical protein